MTPYVLHEPVQVVALSLWIDPEAKASDVLKVLEHIVVKLHCIEGADVYVSLAVLPLINGPLKE